MLLEHQRWPSLLQPVLPPQPLALWKTMSSRFSAPSRNSDLINLSLTLYLLHHAGSESVLEIAIVLLKDFVLHWSWLNFPHWPGYAPLDLIWFLHSFPNTFNFCAALCQWESSVLWHFPGIEVLLQCEDQEATRESTQEKLAQQQQVRVQSGLLWTPGICGDLQAHIDDGDNEVP